MKTAADVIRCARSFSGIPFVHQGRSPEHGFDCVGLVVAVATRLGYVIDDCTNYGRIPNKGLLRAKLESLLLRIDEPEPGSIALFSFDSEPQHVAILTDTNTMIHCYEKIGQCIEHRYADVWRARADSFFWIPGVERL